MVKETQIIVGPEDVKDCGLQCSECETDFMPPIDTPFIWPDACPMCRTPWAHNKKVEKALEFIRVLRALRQEDESPVKVRLVFHDEP